jgi:WD40 repeat protein/transcriptional regulator with XRE-family HTH domain
MDKNRFKERFEYYLRRKGCYQYEVANVINVEASTLSRWVSDPRKWPGDALSAACKFLNLDEDEEGEMFVLAGLAKPPGILKPQEGQVLHESDVHAGQATNSFPLIIFTAIPLWAWVGIAVTALCLTAVGTAILIQETTLNRTSDFQPAPNIKGSAVGIETTTPEGSIIPLGSPVVQRRIPSTFVWRIAWSPDSRFIALDKTLSVGLERAITLYDAETLEEVVDILRGAYAPYMNGLAFNPVGQMLAVGNTPQISIFYGDKYSQRNFLDTQGKVAGSDRIIFSSNGQLMFANAYGQVVGWNTSDWREAFRTSGHGGLFDVTSDGQTIATGSGDIIEIWDVASGNKERSFISQHLDIIADIQFIGTDNLLLSVAADKLSIWDIETGQELTRIEGKSEYYFNAYYEAAMSDFSPDVRFVILQEEQAGRLIALGLQDTKTKKLIGVVGGTYREYGYLALNSDGTMLAATTTNPRYGTLRVWRIEKQKAGLRLDE